MAESTATLSSVPVEPSVTAEQAREREVRRHLGVPDDANRVLLFGETSHWDPNWLLTSEEYYERHVAPIFAAVLDELKKDPRRVWSVESVFFLRMHWERRPAHRDQLRDLVNAGRLKLTGCALTTPDTVIPSGEAILRDYLLGQEWLRSQGMELEPTLAYLPDDFGYSPALPSLLRELGIQRLAVTRLDGMHFIGSDYRPRSAFPLAGSSAEALTNDHGSSTFLWQAPDGAEVLCHWNAFTYFQGDMLAYLGIIRWMGRVYGIPWRSTRHVARRIKAYVRQLSPMAKTPYLFCPIGCDFNPPIPDLLKLLDRYNRERYPDTGVWAVAGGLDDYFDLVDGHRSELPSVTLDPNPYWMGFYASRPDVKRRANRLVHKLLAAEAIAARQGLESGRSPPRDSRITDAWEAVAVSNHHDFVTGTSPDRVWHGEQRPLLQQAEDLVDGALADLERMPHVAPEPTEAPSWTRDGDRLMVTTDVYRLTLDASQGGALTQVVLLPAGRELLSGPANDLVAHRDTGGLWRLGHEFRGGSFEERDRASAHTGTIEVTSERDGVLEIKTTAKVCGATFERCLWIERSSPVIRCRATGLAPRGFTVTCRFITGLRPGELVMDVPGGCLERPVEKIHRPTFWPLRSFVHARCVESDVGLAVYLGGPACAGLTKEGLEWIVTRHAPKETAYRLLPVLAHPARGSENEASTLDYAFRFTAEGDHLFNRLRQEARSVMFGQLYEDHLGDHEHHAGAVLETDDDVSVSALKAASRGHGYIVRLICHDPKRTEVRVRSKKARVRRAWRCDARERNRDRLDVKNGEVCVPVDGRIITVRLLI